MSFMRQDRDGFEHRSSLSAGAPSSVQPRHVATQRRTLALEDREYKAVTEGRIRISIGVIAFALILLFAILRLAELTLLAAEDNGSRSSLAPPTQRANIVDRHGYVLATTVPTYALYARHKYVWDKDETAMALNSIFPDLSIAQLQTRLARSGDQVLIRRGLTPRERQIVFDEGLPGLVFEVEPKRVYPQGALGAHIVGFTNVDMQGLAGAEKAFNERLSAPNAPDLQLSIDIRVQNTLTEELLEAVDTFKAKSAAAVIVDVKSGELMALASVPNFDSNSPHTASSSEKYNTASMSTYELGSIFKPLTLAMALDNGLTNLDESFPVQEPLRVRNFTINDDHASTVALTVPDILAKSSNRGTALIALRAGADMQREFFRSVGLMSRVPFELAENAHPILQSEWQDTTIVTTSYGHGISVTPLALAAATVPLVNGGTYIPPTVLKRDAINIAEPRRVISNKTSQIMRDLLRYVVTDGTGRNANVEGYGVMGKTGTADKPDGDGYNESALVSSFVSAFPYDAPAYVMLVTLDEPQGLPETYGYATAGWNAAPTSAKIIERIAPMLGVSKRAESDPDTLLTKSVAGSALVAAEGYR